VNFCSHQDGADETAPAFHKPPIPWPSMDGQHRRGQKEKH